MLIHGTADPVSPIEGGYSRHRGPNGELRGRTLSLDETAGFWRAVDRCPPGPGDTRTTEFSTRTTAEGGVGGTRVTAWTVFDGGHTWPGARPFPGTAETESAEFDAAEEICRFAGPLLAAADSRRL
jgi:polyhydroxybutyrate depolymerase